MATLQEITAKINTLRGDMTFRGVMNKKLDYLALGRRANHDFVVRTNMRTLRSGPNRGKIRVNGAVITMYGKRNRELTETRLVTNSEKFLSTLDLMVSDLNSIGE